MVAARMHFRCLDDAAKVEVAAVAKLLAAEGQGPRSEVVGIFEEFAKALLSNDGVVFGGLDSELSPEQAGAILGLSRPLVVRRMEDGRLPFTMVGSHRRCLLKDVVYLKEKERPAQEALAEMYELHEDFEKSLGA